MKRYFIAKIISIIILISGSVSLSYSEPAYPFPIKVVQPDGSVITIQMHGDEYANWATCGNRLVARGSDGYYYFADFNATGGKVLTKTRVSPNVMAMPATTMVSPPSSVFMQARIKREKAARVDQRAISQGNRKYLVILVQFSDKTFQSSSANRDFTDQLNLDGYSANSGTGSAWNYFYDNSRGLFNPRFDVVGPVTISKTAAYYGENDEYGDDAHPDEMVEEAVKQANSTVDFSQYDLDGDGVVDNVFIYYCGYAESQGGGSSTIWPHASGIYGRNVVLDGVRISRYACSSEFRGSSGGLMSGIGTFCHEFGHVIGLPDFYDTDYNDNGKGRGLGSYSLMSNGNYNNNGNTPPYFTCMERYLLNWMSFPAEMTTSGSYSLEPVSGNHAYYTPTSKTDEYFLYEYRERTGWDAFLPASGLVIYHVDKSDNDVHGNTASYLWRYSNMINAYSDHQCMDLVESVYPESSVTSGAMSTFPGSTGNRSFTYSTSPAAVEWSGIPTGYDLTNITDNMSSASFTLTIDQTKRLSGMISGKDGFAIAGATVRLYPLEATSGSSVKSAGAPLLLSKSPGIQQASGFYEAITGSDGKYSFILNNYGDFRLVVSKDGYNTAYQDITISDKSTILNMTLYSAYESLFATLRKYVTYNGYGLGYGAPGISTYAAVGFSATEMNPYKGYKIKSIQFIVGGSSASTVGVFLKSDNTTILTRVVSSPVFGTIQKIDLSDANITVQEGKSMKFGYYVLGSDYSFPLAIDNGPKKPQGGFVGQSMDYIYEWDHDMNLVVSVELMDDNNVLYALGYNIIDLPKTQFSVGESVTLRLVNPDNLPDVERPVSVKWFFDDVARNTGDVIILTAGGHTIKAVLNFGDHNETIVQEILVSQ
ncbi:MAG: M6 family metalloprotease domain-containing protein [Bacteroidales bacterium]|nr:M6 family metalloprotease domain-containing protein [Bacteroidales bacterium]